MRHYADEELTEWFGGAEHPSRAGSYQLRYLPANTIVEAWFEQGRWQIGYRGMFSPINYKPYQFEWRGLKERPRLFLGNELVIS